MSKYNYFCKKCNYNYSSDNKDDISEARDNHKLRGPFDKKGSAWACPMQQMNNGHYTRPQIAQ